MDEILTVDDVAERLKVKPITVREMFRDKRLRAFKVGKAWRTTEAMFQEDLLALSRGEEPKKLPDGAAGPKRKPRKPVAKKKPAKKKAAAADKKKSAKDPAADDTQQLLF